VEYERHLEYYVIRVLLNIAFGFFVETLKVRAPASRSCHEYKTNDKARVFGKRQVGFIFWTEHLTVDVQWHSSVNV